MPVCDTAIMNEEGEGMKDAFAPLQESKRMLSIDILRGMAILGIFLVNMPSFHTPILYINGVSYWDESWDRVLYIFSDIFAQASFYPLFAFLFGFGAVILAVRSVDRGVSFPFLFMKRLCFLLAVGCLHAFFIWHGDILVNYAVFGFVFLFFYKWQGKYLIWLGSFLYIVPFAVFGAFFLLMSFVDGGLLEIKNDVAMMKQSLEIYSAGSFIEVTDQRMKDWYMVNNPVNAIFLFFSIFPFFLIGAGVAKQGWLQNVSRYKRSLRMLAIISFLTGLAIKLLPYITVNDYGTTFVQDYFGGPLLTMFYITAIALLVERAWAYKSCYLLSFVGRMSMSNYLFQSIVCSLIFYSYGLGLYGKVRYTEGFLLMMAVFSIQLLLSYWWMKRFRFGPVEYVWRFITYGKKPVMKRGEERP
ncbi:DUF418 domain-containing protein [Peribacillus sp. NPDC097295]|uniref:DUF418 domain-containing protein n=1 Tax=Peribacillus sp. NPDC097295 TaxID=3364402 RepID=UPI0038048635